jgi:hypothetical protein
MRTISMTGLDVSARHHYEESANFSFMEAGYPGYDWIG